MIFPKFVMLEVKECPPKGAIIRLVDKKHNDIFDCICIHEIKHVSRPSIKIAIKYFKQSLINFGVI